MEPSFMVRILTRTREIIKMSEREDIAYALIHGEHYEGYTVIAVYEDLEEARGERDKLIALDEEYQVKLKSYLAEVEGLSDEDTWPESPDEPEYTGGYFDTFQVDFVRSPNAKDELPHGQ